MVPRYTGISASLQPACPGWVHDVCVWKPDRKERKGMIRINSILLLYALIWVGLLLLASGCSFSPDECEEIEKKYESLHAEYSTIHETDKVYEECKNDLRKCPKLSIIYELMARINYDEEYQEDALEYYRRALHLNSDNPLLKQKIDDLRAMIRDGRESKRRLAGIEIEKDEMFRRETAARERELEARRLREDRLEREEQAWLERDERRKKAEERRRKREAARSRARNNKTSAIGNGRR